MFAIAGAILIHAACVLMASGKDTFDIYGLQRILVMVGFLLVVSEATIRVREFFRKAWQASSPPQPPTTS
jgi:hypothetical protein